MIKARCERLITVAVAVTMAELSAVTVTEISTVTVTSKTVTITMGQWGVSKDWSGVHHALGDQWSGLGNQWDWDSCKWVVHLVLIASYSLVYLTSWNLNGHWSWHSHWDSSWDGVWLWDWHSVGLWNTLDDWGWDWHEVVHLAAVFGLRDGGVEGLGVRSEHGGGLVHDWAVGKWGQSMTTVWDGSGDREDSGEHLRYIQVNAVKCG